MNDSTPDSQDELSWLGIAEGARRLRDGSLSPVEWTEALLARIEGQGAALNAFLHLDPELSLAQARRAKQLLSSPDRCGPLTGVPCAIKDIFETADMPTTAHSRLLAGNRPDRDARAVARLREAGMVILGKPQPMSSPTAGLRLICPGHPPAIPGIPSISRADRAAARALPLRQAWSPQRSVPIPAGRSAFPLPCAV